MNMTVQSFLEKLINRKDLTIMESEELLDLLTRPETTASQIAAALIALCSKGESVSEITGFIKGMRGKMKTIVAKGAIDVCGTGGDGSGTFNISTCVAFVVAGAGVLVAKHGNRAASSKSGSADVLESLEVNILLTPQQAEQVLKKVSMVFLFAPMYHNSFKKVGEVRKELGVRTIFNFLGPMVSPARVTRQLIGVPNIAIAKKLAKTAMHVGYTYLAIVASEDGLDEISINRKTTVFEVKGKSVKRYSINPKKYFVHSSRFTAHSLKGGSAKQNSEIIISILQGIHGPKRDTVVLNSALALVVAGKAKDLQEGILKAEESIDMGKALQVLRNLQKETQRYA